MGPGQGGSQVGMGLGGRKYLGEDIGPGPGRVPGLFRQKRGNIILIRQSVQFLSMPIIIPHKSAIICVNSG